MKGQLVFTFLIYNLKEGVDSIKNNYYECLMHVYICKDIHTGSTVSWWVSSMIYDCFFSVRDYGDTAFFVCFYPLSFSIEINSKFEFFKDCVLKLISQPTDWPTNQLTNYLPEDCG